METQQIFFQMMESLEKLTNPEIRIYTISEAAQLLKCKESTIKNLIYRSRELPTCQIGRELRIREEDLKKFLQRRVTPCVFDQGVLS